MDYFKTTEKYLYNYKSLKTSIEINKEKLRLLQKEEPQGPPGINYEKEPVSPTHKFYSETEDEAIARIQKIEKVKNKIQKDSYAVWKIEKAIESLPVLERRVVKLRYISEEQLTWRQIADIVKYNTDYCRKEVRNRAIQSLSVAIFGQDALKNPALPPTQAG